MTLTKELATKIEALVAMESARTHLYSIAGGSLDSGDVYAASLSTAQRIDFFRSTQFRDW